MHTQGSQTGSHLGYKVPSKFGNGVSKDQQNKQLHDEKTFSEELMHTRTASNVIDAAVDAAVLLQKRSLFGTLEDVD